MWPKTLPELARKVEGRIRVLRQREAPREACGLVWPDGTICQVPNRSPHPEDSFLMFPRDIAHRQAEYKMNPVALFHTHVDNPGEPSSADRNLLKELASYNSIPIMFIYGKDGLRGWTWDDETLQEIDLKVRDE